MSLIERRWIVSTGELWLPDGSPTSKPDPETEDWVVLAEDYDALADQLRGAVAENEKLRLQVAALENDGMELAARLGEADEQIARLTNQRGGVVR
jgi:chromosome segregation ATPase